ncbi:hypothetical protein [Actinoplanes sp. NPDC049118]|uniref:hypothetical protein n=1 Tax=Actinoplanes sp. NPDC049118 TaxID=3155769 RepID=UPI0033C61004
MGKSRDLEFDYEITVVDGERGRRLAAVQTAAIQEVLESLHCPVKASAAGHPPRGDTSADNTDTEPDRQ